MSIRINANGLPAQIIQDIDAFARAGLNGISDKALLNSQDKARVVSFKNAMEKGITKNIVSPTNIQVRSSTEQGMRFETGYEGVEKITPLIREWADYVKVHLPKNAETIHVDYKDTRFRMDTYKFMFNSIPTEAEVKAELDRVINSTLRGGTVYG